MASGDWIDQVSQLFSNPRGLWEDITGTGLQREQFEYQKQLQQQIFEREDTAWQRAAADAQKVGLNPMSLTSGANAGSVVPTSMDTSGNIQGINSMINALGTASNISNAINEFKTGNTQRDLLRTEQQRQKMENALFAYENGLTINRNGSISVSSDSPIRKRLIQQSEMNARDTSTEGQKTTNKRNERVLNYQERTGTNDTTPDKINTIASGADMISQANKRFNESEQDSIARIATSDMMDKAEFNMWNKIDDYLNGKTDINGNPIKKSKNSKKPNFFQRYLNYRFGTNFGN